MNSNEMKRPNIFDYAQKELTQDAMVCWLLKCCHSSNEKYREIGLDFIKLVTGAETDNIELETDSPHKQYYHMDVYANVRIKDKVYPIIFEDKTDTYLHSGQHERYLNTVKQWKTEKQWKEWREGLFGEKNLEWGETIFVFFKIGYVFDWQRKELDEIAEKIKNDNAVLKIITLEDMEKFIAAIKAEDELLLDYLLFLRNKLANIDNSTEANCNRYFKKIFGEEARFNYSYQEWAAKDFAYIEDISKHDANRIAYSIRTGWWKNGSEYEYAIAVQQYRNEKNIVGSEEEKERLRKERYEITAYSRELCEKIFAQLCKEGTPELEDRNKLPDQNNLFKKFVNDKNEDEMCRFFHDFIGIFTKKLQAKYNVIDIINN